jgi:hypothetical protein
MENTACIKQDEYAEEEVRLGADCHKVATDRGFAGRRKGLATVCKAADISPQNCAMNG